MKPWITQALGLCTALLMLSSCEKDEVRAVLQPNAAPALNASATTATITSTNTSASAVTYTWTPADFGYPAAVTYTLQFAKQGTDFASTQDISMGTELTKSFTVGELNELYNGLDCNITTIKSTPLDVRVKASVGEAAAPTYSSVTTLTAAPYQAQALPANKWAIIGSATPGGWDKETPMTYDFCSRVWKITLPLTANEFKFRANDKWDLNLGDDGADGKLEGNGANIVVPASGAGMYDVILDMNATPKPVFTIRKK